MNMKVGDIYETKRYGELEIISYKSSLEVEVQFLETNTIKFARADHIRNGQVRDPYKPSVMGVGVVGNNPVKVGGNNTTLYNEWSGMLTRCFCKKLHEKFPTYKDCTVDPSWLYLDNFKSWYYLNYREGFSLDKDILFKNNKHYSPKTCRYVPPRINGLVIRNESIRKGLPIGVSKKAKDAKFCARCQVADTQPKTLGYFDTPEEAFIVYKNFKESYIKSVAKEYFLLDLICTEVYSALLNYTVEITD